MAAAPPAVARSASCQSEILRLMGGRLLLRILIAWGVNIVALLVIDWIFSGVEIGRWWSVILGAAVLGIDTCPMEGIQPPKYDEILGLTGTNFATVVACAAGYRLPDDKYATTKKVRFKHEDVIVRV